MLRTWIRILIFATVLSTAAGASSPAQHAASDGPTMGLKNFREILRGLATVTHVSASRPEIQAYYKKIQGQLPQSGSLTEFSPQSWLAAAGLGSVFCDLMIIHDIASGPAGGLNEGVDFAQGPSALSPALRTQLAQRYIVAFLQRPAKASEEEQLVRLIATQGESSNTPKDTRNGLLAVCSTVASSIEFLSN